MRGVPSSAAAAAFPPPAARTGFPSRASVLPKAPVAMPPPLPAPPRVASGTELPQNTIPAAAPTMATPPPLEAAAPATEALPIPSVNTTLIGHAAPPERPASVAPFAPFKPLETKPLETKPLESKPLESKPTLERGSIPPAANPSLLIPRPPAGATPQAGADPRITQLEVQAQATRALLARAAEETQQALRRAEAAEERAQALASRLEALEQRVSAEQDAMLDKIRQAEALATRPVSLAHLEERVERVETLSAKGRAALATAQQDLAEHGRLFESRKARLDSVDARLSHFENDPRLKELHRSVERLDLRMTGIETQKDGALAPLVERLVALESRATGTGTRKAPPPEEVDELQAVQGIGPKYAKRLRELGITRAAQIAAWSDADLTKFAEALGLPKKRLEKLGWVEAAKALIAG